MSLCINNDLIWLSIPKCASTSIEEAFLNSTLDCKYPHNYKKRYYDKGFHLHLEVEKLYNFFGIKETICINRDWFDRWVSALEFMWKGMEESKLEPIIKWEDIDNNWLYTNFTKEYVDKIHFINRNVNKYIDVEMAKLKYEYTFYFTKIKDHPFKDHYFYPAVLLSQNTWKKNNKCTYEFDFKELYKFENFITNRYGMEFKLEKLNASNKLSNKIVKDNTLKNWVWENFEKRFERRNELI